MIALRSFLARLWNYTRRARTDREFSEELESHLELSIADNLRSGLDATEARRRAILLLGGIESAREAQRERRGFPLIDTLFQDLRHSARGLLRSPGFTLVAVVTLALSIAATASLFSVIDATLLAPLQTPDAEKLVWIDEFSAGGEESGGTPLRLADWQHLKSFDSAAGFYDEGLVLTGEGEIRRIDALRMFGPLGKTLHARLALGRWPSAEEASGRDPSLVLTYRLWKSLYNQSPAVLGHVVHLGGKAYPVIGVLSDDVKYPDVVDVWIPAPSDVQSVPRTAGFLGQVARLGSGATQASAQAEMNVVSASLAEQHPDTDRGRRAQVIPLHDHVTSASRASLLTLFGAIASVFLVACLNVAGLLLARGLSRRREAAIRLALGAGRERLVRLFLAEGLLLSLVGGACGLAFAALGIELLMRVLPADIPRLATVALDLRTVLFTAMVIGVSAALCGVVPALQLASRATVGALNEGTRTIGGPRERLRGVLVVGEVAASVVLLVVAGLLAGSYLQMRKAQLGFRPEQAMSFTVLFSWDTPTARLNAFSTQALERVARIPGVQAVGIVDRLPLHGGSQSGPVVVRGLTLPEAQRNRAISWRTATPGYFAAAAVPVLSGSLFEAYRGPQGPKVAMINERLAQFVFHGVNPIGREISRREGLSAPSWFRVVGVIGDVRQEPSDMEAEPEVYIPWGATYWPVMNFVVRSGRPVPAIAREIHDTVQRLTAQQVIENVAPLGELTDETESAPRGRAWLLASFAIAATMLAAVGIFGLLSQEVVRRMPEFGIRLALGADPRDLFWVTTFRGLRLVTVGLIGGMLLSILATRLVGSLLFAGGAVPISSYLLASAVILIIAFFASVLPGIRAARVDPMSALRGD